MTDEEKARAEPEAPRGFVNPDGTGPNVDATIELWVLDAFGDPIYLYPFSDMWLETESKGMVLCPGGSVADQSTDINGYTTFSSAMYAGCCGSGMLVIINGTALSQPALDLRSPAILSRSQPPPT